MMSPIARSGRAEIYLNADEILLQRTRPSPFFDMFSTLLHEMW